MRKFIIIYMLVCLLSGQAVMAQEHYVMSVAASTTSWASLETLVVALPAAGGEAVVKLNTNLNMQVVTRPAWLTPTFEDKNTLKVVARANNSKNKRQYNLALKGKEGKSLTVQIYQYGSTPVAVTDKSEVSFYGDKFVDSFKVMSNVDYTVESPEWLKREYASDGKYVFSAKRLYGQSSREGDICINDASGNLLTKVKINQRYHKSNWFEKPTFAVISDIHVGDETFGQIYSYRMPRVIKTLNKYDPTLQAVIIIGDLADHGREEEYRQVVNYFNNPSTLDQKIEKYFIRGNHDNIQSNGKNYFTSIVHPEVNRYFEIKGYPFITLSSDNSLYRGEGYNSSTLDFLKKSLIAADRDYPGKPIFVFSHLLPKNTIIGSYPVSTGDQEACADGLDEIFSQYPQVISFSGHTHRNISNAAQIYQKNYTAVNDGSQKRDSYSGGYNHLGAQDEVDYDCITEGLFVHISEDDEVVIERWNTSRGVNYENDWVIAPPFDGTNFSYMNRTGGKAPWWPAGAALTVGEKTKTTCHLTFPQAIDDGEGVNYYRIDVVNAAGTKVMSTLGQSALQYMGPHRPDHITVPLKDLPTGVQLTASVYARDYYNMDSPTLKVTFTLE